MKITRLYASCPFSSLGVLLASLLSATALQAETLVGYDMQTVGKQTIASTVVDGVTTTSLTGSKLNSEPGKLENPTGTYYTTWSPGVGGGTSAIEAVYTESTYFSFTVTPEKGKPITITSLSFDVFAATAGPSARQLYVLSDKSGFDDTKVLLSASTVSGVPLIPYNTAAGQPFFIDLSDNSAFHNIADGVTFRFYIQTPDAGQSLAFSDIQISGSIGGTPSTTSLSFIRN